MRSFSLNSDSAGRSVWSLLLVDWRWVLVLLILISQAGCLMTREQAIRKVAYVASFNAAEPVTVSSTKEKTRWYSTEKYFAKKNQPSERTQRLMRKYNLLDYYAQRPESVIEWLQKLVEQRPTMEEVHALAELAEIEAAWLSDRGKSDAAMKNYVIALSQSYQFLFSSELDVNRNAYDPQFRSICDIYNASLKGLLKQVCEHGPPPAGERVQIGDSESGLDLEFKVVGRWKDQQFERFELVANYETEGLLNQYHTYGLGVPLIAVRKQQAVNHPVEKYYPPDLSLPMTAFCHFQDGNQTSSGRRSAVLTLYDPLEQTTVTTDSQVVPLESDITTPLAYHMRDPVVYSGVLETASLLNAELAPELYGMYMLEPYDPSKIPVVMVHGLWSSPMTWIHMFNDLRASADIHTNYQFWFYSYPTGQPFWLSARQMREDLAQVRRELDPRGDSESLDQMILVGHSMGGLVSTLQAMDSGQAFWEMVSDERIETFTGDEATLQKLRDTFYFTPSPSIRRVITIASPFAGSDFASAATRWVSQKMFTLPESETQSWKKIAQKNRGKLKDSVMLTSATSLDSLAPKAAVFAAMKSAETSRSVTFHNIYGRIPKRQLISFGRESEFQGDGVVSLQSAETSRAVSQVAVPAEHSQVHQHPACIYEVHRILLQNLVELDRIRDRFIPQLLQDTADVGS